MTLKKSVSTISWQQRVPFAILTFAISCPIALSYSYDDLVRLSQAEQRTFSRVDMSQSVDDRVRNLEVALFGSAQSGSDSSRVRRICNRAGIPYPEPEVPALAPDFRQGQSATPLHRHPSPWGDTSQDVANVRKKAEREKRLLEKEKEKKKKEQAAAIALSQNKKNEAKKAEQARNNDTVEKSESPSLPRFTENAGPITVANTSSTASSTSTSGSNPDYSSSNSSSSTTAETNTSTEAPHSVDAQSTSGTSNDSAPTSNSPPSNSSTASPLANPLAPPPVYAPPPALSADGSTLIPIIIGSIFVAFLSGAGIVFLVLKSRLGTHSSIELGSSQVSSQKSLLETKGAIPNFGLLDGLRSSKAAIIGLSAVAVLAMVGLGFAAYFLIPSADNELRAAQSSFDKADYNSALVHINKALEFDSKRNDLHVMKGRILTSSGNGQAAVEELSKVLGSEPLNPEALYYRAEGYKAIQDYSRAIADYNELLKRNEHILDCYLSLGKLYCIKKEFDKSLEASKQALALSPGNAIALWNCGLVYREKGEYQRALAYLNDAKTRDKQLLIHADRGFCLYKLGRYKEAAADLEQARRDNSSDMDSCNFLGLVYDAMGQYMDAVDVMEVALDRYRDDENYKNTMKLLCDHLASQSRRILLVHPRDAKAHANLACALYNKREFVEALNSAKLAISLEPGNARNYYIAGMCQFEARKFEDALKYFDQAMTLSPTWEHCRFELARALSATHNYNEANKTYSQLIRRRYSEAACYRNMASNYYNLYDFKTAVLMCQKSLEFDQTDSSTWLRLGESYAILLDSVKATDCYKTCLKIDPKSDRALVGLADQQLQLRDLSGALETMELYRNNRPDYQKHDGYYFALLKIYAAKGEYEKALEASDRSCALDPDYVIDAMVSIAADRPDRVKASLDKVKLDEVSPAFSPMTFLLLTYTQQDQRAKSYIRAVEQKLKQEAWPAPVIHLYSGSLSMEDFLRKYENDPKADQTELHTYAGCLDYFAGRKESARKHFDWVKANGIQAYIEPILVYGLMRKNGWY